MFSIKCHSTAVGEPFSVEPTSIFTEQYAEIPREGAYVRLGSMDDWYRVVAVRLIPVAQKDQSGQSVDAEVWFERCDPPAALTDRSAYRALRTNDPTTQTNDPNVRTSGV